MTVCQQCGEQNPERFRLCGMCGAPLNRAIAPREVRKTVTVLFSDLKGSTGLGEQLDSESLRDALGVYFAEMRAVIERHGGLVEKYIGDAIMAVFGLPAVSEDDALRAVRAASEMQKRLTAVNEELRRRWGIELENRTGVNTGEVVAGDASLGQRLVTGDTVNTAARLEQAAPAREVLLGQLTYDLVRDAVEVESVDPLELKGKADRVPAYRLVRVADAATLPRRLQGPLVGRADELAQLDEAERRVAAARIARIVTVIGTAGVGKSRLIDEFLATDDRRARSARGRCLSYGDGITFWPIAEMIRAAAALDDELPRDIAMQRLMTLCGDREDVAARLAPLLGLSDATHSLEETFWAVRTLFEVLAQERPLVVVIDDIHWAEPTLLDLLDHVRQTASAGVLILCSARAELLELRPEWAKESEIVGLQPLSGPETETVVVNILGRSGLPPELLSKITAAAEGNPLFVEQMLSMLVDRGDLVRTTDETWEVRGDVTSVPVPPGIVALIEARLDRLGSEDRSVLQAGSVIGIVFYRTAVRAITPPELGSIVDESLARLTRRQFVRPDASTFMDEDTVRFDHALIHDSAYRSLLKRERAEFHEKFGRWLESAAEQRTAELEEIIGYHLAQSADHLGQLGPLDDRGLGLARDASHHLGVAGRRALSRGDSPAAATLLERSSALLPADSSRRIELVLDLAEACADLGDFQRSEVAVTEALEAAKGLGDELLVRNAELVSLFLRYTLDPHDGADIVLRDTEAAMPVLERAGDHAGLVRAWRLLAWIHGTACRYGAAEAAVERAVHHARLAGDRRAETRNLMSFAISALYGPMPVGRAIELAWRIAGDVDGDRRAEGIVLAALAQLHALRGDFAEARTLYQQARRTLEALGGSIMAARVSLDSSRAELLAGDPVAAERELRHDFDLLESVGERYALSTVAGLLAEALVRQGRIDEALLMSGDAERMAAGDDIESQALWRRVRAAALAALGRAAEAVSLAEDAHRLIAETDAPLMKGATLVDLGAAYAAADRHDDAVRCWTDATALFEAKEASVPAAATRHLLNASRQPRP
ncbi:MAG: ATP-binding protein [Candidatus Limnocylindria bacterium]